MTIGNYTNYRVGCAVIWAFVVVTAGCSPPGVSVLPNTDIVYQVMAGHTGQTYTVGFVNADGTGVTVTDFHQGAGSAILPARSADGRVLMFRGSEIGAGIADLAPLFIWREGQALSECSSKDSFGSGPLHIAVDGKSALVSTMPESPPKLAIVDTQNCQVETLSVGNNSWGGSFGPSDKITFWTWKDKAIEITDLADASHRVTQVAHGIASRWSPDGEWIAYTAADGIYVVKRDGTGMKRLVPYNSLRLSDGGWEEWPPVPSWSPDGRWLVYHKCTLPEPKKCAHHEVGQYSIFKVDVETGIEVKILDGGLNPYWR